MERNHEMEMLMDAVIRYWGRRTKQPLSKQGINCLWRFRILGLNENDLCAAMEKGLEEEPDNPLFAFEVFCQYCWNDVADLETINPMGRYFQKKQDKEDD